MEGKLLIVDDHKHVLNALRHLLRPEFELVKAISNPNSILTELEKENFDLILLDMNFSAAINTGNEGMYWLQEIKKVNPETAVVLITAYGDVELAVKAIKSGATDFILKPWNNDKLIHTLKSAYELIKSKRQINKLQKREKHITQAVDKQFGELLGNSPAMQEVKGAINKVASTDANVLILGENGTGKELIAREIHRKSLRSEAVFMNIDLGSVHENLFESELFGHVKGAFTSAIDDKPGKFELANGGSLFLDEIGNLPYLQQAKLLTVLEQRELTPTGSTQKIPIDVRLICATNQDLQSMVKEHLFREDLFFRINTIIIEAPPLRERGEDIILLAQYYLKNLSDKYQKSNLKINNAALDMMMQYSWPGNVRELRHVVERAVIFTETNTLKPEDFGIEPNHKNVSAGYKTLTEIEKDAIHDSLKRHDYRIAEVAKELGVARQTLYNKIEKYGLQ